MPDDKPPDKTKRATALRYEEGDTAPQVVATGRGLIAEKIIAEAKAAGIPVREDSALAQALAALELEKEIPGDLYTAVAEALAWAYRADVKAKARY